MVFIMNLLTFWTIRPVVSVAILTSWQRPHPVLTPVEACFFVGQSVEEVLHVLFWCVKLAIISSSVVVFTINPVGMKLPLVVGKE